MKVVVGLGNYGDKYAYTFHNMGFLTVEALADKLGFKFSEKECDSLVAVGYRKGEKIVIAKPLTYMNLSGVAVNNLWANIKSLPKT
ncbi:MAG: aminoacyl-tRNA hydrolase [Clostridia bacterium]|nr:aminoacyl-tRNA hydrolase [Clostridia bacterium]